MKLGGMPMHIEGGTAEVFDFLADVEHEADWNPDIKSVRRLGSGPVGEGTSWEGMYRGMGAMRVRLDVYDPPRRLAFSTTGSRVDMQVVFEFATGVDPTATDIVVSAEIRPKGAMVLLTPFLRPMMRRTFARRPAQVSAGLAAVRGRREDASS